jgi:hypothetical protein
MIKGIFYIEAQGNSRRLVENSLKTMAKKLRGEENITVKKESFGEVIREGGVYSSTLEVELEFRDFLTYVMAAIQYGPSAIEVLEPEKIRLSAKELLEVLGEVIRVSRSVYEKFKVYFKFPQDEELEVGLTEEEIEELLADGAIRAKIVVEARGRTRNEAKKQILRAMAGADVFINKIKSKKVESERPFSGVVGLDAFMYGASTLFDIAVRHTPVLVEIIEPEEIELSMLEIQDIGVDLAGVFFELAFALSKSTT